LLLFCPVLYAVPPLPPLKLLMPGSLWTEPGDVAELPGLTAVIGFNPVPLLGHRGATNYVVLN
jgi:hypothetical protein